MTPTAPTTATSQGPLAGESRLLIDGELADASDGGTLENMNPSTGEVAGLAASATAQDMERAIAAARRAFDEGSWANDPEFRSRCLMQLHAAINDEQERLRRIIVTESGSPISLTYAVQLKQPLEETKYWAEMARDFTYEYELEPHENRGRTSRRIMRHEATGVVAAITPWNYPFYLDVAESVPALAAGNAVILKPAQITPWSGLELGRLVAERTDIPAGIFQVLTTTDHSVTEQLTTDPRVDMVTLTGSTATGRRVLAAGADTVKKIFLELGGKSAHVVLEDADFATVIPGAAVVCSHAGQGCTLSTRLLVPRSRYEEAKAILKATFERVPVGDVWDMGTLQGPQVSAKQRDSIVEAIANGVAEGATLLVGGHAMSDRPGYYVEPTVLVDVDPNSALAQEEIFGPVLCVIPYDTVDEAVEIANATIYGLAGEVSGGSESSALAVARRLRAGNISVNGGMYFSVSTPLGGYKQSGIGRRNGEEGFREYMELKAIGIPAA
ncbi:aldehyde dehydrogenase [Pseudoclavibacter sp. RFBJ3]|uniref:aldehyde dehydrogenase family protein n=1 Tax=unclassified Pseudoclavibacter TaxID=2615177 RepID=UPI000CE857F8|nr:MULTISPECIES: aldehyde dehydrogenase family protein [unclassified Pseudoclavibacter]PPF87298.1 aldehyde dehydrogenase [Pseudoclavibacter sp. RFBJ5]PPF90302.1 aldehyde dehydrogenase [Pseudoclavibacter sp. RFBJ3]PPG00820.1 aldehyde dehydrogenase [Pseudoclavibacter sp. RFBH5]PPG26068.1 aldehyde dehydrogenase [Pseudoclavibacter sp. RFBI4]